MNKLPRSVQTGILILVWSLAVIWLYSPERIRAFEHSFNWYVALVRGLWNGPGAAELTLLKPIDATAAVPLAEFGTVAFMGCDLNMQDGRLYLVTRWRGALHNVRLAAHLMFVSNGKVLFADRWPLDQERHESPAPLAFFADNKGEIWLTIEDTLSDKAIMPTASVLPVVGESVRICK